MKTYKLLGHVFQMEDRAYSFLESYVRRIDEYANEQGIHKDILEDIKYNIIEKLYAATTPIKEAFVMNLAESIGEPESIFEERDGSEKGEKSESSNLLQRWFGVNKPQIWGVCYWIAKSLGISVLWVRLFFLIAIPFWGLSIWVYPVLALFVPFKDKASTTGKSGNLFFEIVRILLWLMILFPLCGMFLGGVLGISLFASFPDISGQVIQWTMPWFYPVAGIGMLALTVLLIGAFGALFKQYWIKKGIIVTAIIGFALSGIVASSLLFGVAFHQFGVPSTQYKTELLSGERLDGKKLSLEVSSDVKNYLLPFGGAGYWFFDIEGKFSRAEHIEIIPSEDDTISAWIETELRSPRSDSAEAISSKLTPIQTKFDKEKGTLAIHFPSKMFSPSVPFVMAERKVVIAVPKDMRITYSNSTVGKSDNIFSSYSLNRDGDVRYSCLDMNELVFNQGTGRRVCKNAIIRGERRGSDLPTSGVPVDQSLILGAESAVENTQRNQISPSGTSGTTTTSTTPTTQVSNQSRGNPAPNFNGVTVNQPQNNYNPYYYDYTEAKERDAERAYIGKTLADAQRLAQQRGETIRVTEENGIDRAPATDFVPGRIKVELRNGRIIDVDIEGEKQLNQVAREQAQRTATSQVAPTPQAISSAQNTTLHPQNPAPQAQNSPAARERNAERTYLGKTLAEAQRIAQQRGEVIRVTEQDDIDMAPARDFVPGRIQVELKRGIITDVDIEGYDD